MKISIWLKEAEATLRAAGIATGRLDALVLLEDTTGIDRARLIAEPDLELTSTQLKELNNLLTRRQAHEPLAYVRGKSEFYGREFVITPDVLEPRPESETMIELLKNLPAMPSEVLIADVGTGSGALGITAKLELNSASVDLIDVEQAALKVAKMNVDKFTLNISVYISDLLSAYNADADVLLCNLPYVPDDFEINLAASHEPGIAIFGGADGLDLYRKLFDQLDKRNSKPLYILSESLPPQHKQLQQIALNSGYNLYLEDDFIQVFRLAAPKAV